MLTRIHYWTFLGFHAGQKTGQVSYIVLYHLPSHHHPSNHLITSITISIMMRIIVCDLYSLITLPSWLEYNELITSTIKNIHISCLQKKRTRFTGSFPFCDSDFQYLNSVFLQQLPRVRMVYACQYCHVVFILMFLQDRK